MYKRGNGISRRGGDEDGKGGEGVADPQRKVRRTRRESRGERRQGVNGTRGRKRKEKGTTAPGEEEDGRARPLGSEPPALGLHVCRVSRVSSQRRRCARGGGLGEAIRVPHPTPTPPRPRVPPNYAGIPEAPSATSRLRSARSGGVLSPSPSVWPWRLNCPIPAWGGGAKFTADQFLAPLLPSPQGKASKLTRL